MGRIAGATPLKNDRPQDETGQDVALLRPFLGTLVVGLYSLLVLGSYDSFIPPYVPGWEGKVPYFSRWDIALPWLILTAALAAYLAGVLAIRRWGKALVATSVVAVATLVAGLLLTQAAQTRDRGYAEFYGPCRQLSEIKDPARSRRADPPAHYSSQPAPRAIG